MCFTIIHTISGNLQNNDYQKKESVRDEWTLSAIGYFVLSPVARSCLVAMNKITIGIILIGMIVAHILALRRRLLYAVVHILHIGELELLACIFN